MLSLLLLLLWKRDVVNGVTAARRSRAVATGTSTGASAGAGPDLDARSRLPALRQRPRLALEPNGFGGVAGAACFLALA